MKTALEQLHQDVERVRNLIKIHDDLLKHPESHSDISDILRGCIVLLVSALDTFIHEVVRIGMMQILRGEREQTETYKKFSVTLQQINFDPNYAWLDRQVRERHKDSSFQTPKAIQEAIKNIFDDKDLWEKIAQQFHPQSNKKLITDELKLIVNRRNQIAHEADIDFGQSAPVKREINAEDVKKSIDFIEKMTKAIYTLLEANSQQKTTS